MAGKIQYRWTDRLGRANLFGRPSAQRTMCARTNLSRDLGNGFLYKAVLSAARSAALTARNARVCSPQCLARRPLGNGLPLAAASRRTALVDSGFGGRSPHCGAAHLLHSFFFFLSGNSDCSSPAQGSYGFSLSAAACGPFWRPSEL